MPVAVANGEFLNFSAPYLCSHTLIEKFKEGGVAAFEVIPKRLSLLVIQRELDLQPKLIDIEVDDFGEVIGHKVEMCKRSDHRHSLSSLAFYSRGDPYGQLCI